MASDLEIQSTGNGAERAIVETAASAAAARAKAVVEARYIVAMKRPRSMDEVRVRLLNECKRPGFAEVAKYEKPVGGKSIVGLSVRFVEAAIRLMGNVSVDIFTTFDDLTRRIVRVEVVDLETNTPYGQDIPIEKTVERSQPSADREVLGTRTNTQGKAVYLVAATEDEFMNKQNSHISKVLRNHGLRLVPGDILDECSRQIDDTYRNKAAQDPEGEKKKIIDSFASIGVKPTQLAEYLEHALDALVPAELATLRRLYQTIREGETTWQAIVEEKFGERAPGGVAEGAGTAAGQRPRPVRKAAAQPTETKPQDAAASAPAATATVEAPAASSGPSPTAAGPAPEPEKQQPAAPAPAKAKAAKLSPTTFGRIFELVEQLDEKHGAGTHKKLLEQELSEKRITDLDEAKGTRFVEILEKALAA